MISHKYKCIFIHIPKCAGSSITEFFFPNFHFNIFKPDYENLFGWCPERKIHLQHATTKQLIETKLISKYEWDEYFKFTFVRNPWDRAVSDYFWMKKELNIDDSFQSYLNKRGKFNSFLNDNSNIKYRGDHLIPQTDFFYTNGEFKIDFIGRFENFQHDINQVLTQLNVEKPFLTHINKSSNLLSHYSYFYSFKTMKLIGKKYKNDIDYFDYKYVEKKRGMDLLKHWF